MSAHSDSTSSAVSVLDGALVLPATVAAGPRRRRRATRTRSRSPPRPRCRSSPAPSSAPGVLILATTSPPYDEGGSVQALAELTGLAGDIVAFELTSSLRDGLTALRLAAALLAAGGGTALVCAAHRSARREGRGRRCGRAPARGATAGSRRFGPGPLAGRGAARPLAARRRGRRQRRRPELRLGRRRAAGRARVGARGAVASSARSPARPAGPSAPSAAPGDELAAAVGVLGAAHALGRLVLAPRPAAGRRRRLGRADRGDRGRARARRSRHCRRGAPGPSSRRRASATLPEPVDWSQLTPYASGPRSWRERGQDLRLEGSRCGGCGRVLFPPPRDLPPLRQPRARARAARPRRHRRDGDAGSRLPRLALDRDGRRRARRRRQVLRAGRSRRRRSRSATACGSCRAACTTAAVRPSTSGSSRRRR